MLDSFLELFYAVWTLLATLGQTVLPWLPLIVWCVFWLFAVNWQSMHKTLWSGGWIAILLIAATAVLVWGSVDPSTHDFGITASDYQGTSNFVGKTVYVTGLLAIMMLCGAVQNSGAVDRFISFADEPEAEPADAHH